MNIPPLQSLTGIESVLYECWLDGHICTDEASILTGIAAATLATWRSRGGGPPFSKVGSIVRYKRRDLIEFMAAHRMSNTIKVS